MLDRIKIVGCAALVLGACGTEETGRSSARVSEIEWTTQSNGTTTLGRVEVSYDGDHVKAITYRENGQDAGRMDFTYGGSLVDKIDVTDAEGDRANYNWNYGDGRLKTIRWSVADIVSLERKFEYDDANAGRPRRTTSTTSWVGSTPTEVVATYDYDAEGRLEEITTIDGDVTHTSEVRYDADSRIERYTEYNADDVMDADLSYDERGRLELVDAGDDRYEISYDDAGMIEEILALMPSASQTMTVRYRYDAGEVSGLTFDPSLPVAGLIDLRGVAFDQPAFTSFAPPLDLGDVPHVELSTCAHDACVSGVALDASCDECAATVCASDDYCCTTSWDSTCVQAAASACGC